MGFGATRAVALRGIDGTLVEVECDTGPGLVSFTVSGLPDAACAQAPKRIQAALANSNLGVDPCRVIMNLSPASIPKTGAMFDLPMAIALLMADGQLKNRAARQVAHLGELGLDGSVRPVRGVLPAVLAAARAGVRDVVVPIANAREAALVPEVRVHGVEWIGELCNRYREGQRRARLGELGEPFPPVAVETVPEPPDLRDVVGQDEARHALEVAAAGGHHMFLAGPPGAGKTMLAARLPGLLPVLGRGDALEVTSIHSLIGELPAGLLVDRAPFVAPHHGASMPALVGGGSARVRPGAVSQAHRGVLFLDEAPEFSRRVLDALRQPLESGRVTIARAHQSTTYPARFQLVLAANPCPCGGAVGKGRGCTCTPLARRTYLARLSGPLLDRVDVHLTVHSLSRAALAAPLGEPTAVVAQRVALARERQGRRLAELGHSLNGDVPGPLLRGGTLCLGQEAVRDLDRALDRGMITLRGYDRVLRLAWTEADLSGRDRPGRDEVRLAMTLRGCQEVAA